MDISEIMVLIIDSYCIMRHSHSSLPSSPPLSQSSSALPPADHSPHRQWRQAKEADPPPTPAASPAGKINHQTKRLPPSKDRKSQGSAGLSQRGVTGPCLLPTRCQAVRGAPPTQRVRSLRVAGSDHIGEKVRQQWSQHRGECVL